MNKKLKVIIVITAIIASVAGIIGGGLMYSQDNSDFQGLAGKRILIAYYSYSGNTKAVAEKIQSYTAGDIFEIKPKKAYPSNYNDVVNIAQKEKSEGAKPELIENGNTEGYDIIFIGTPVWWYTMASPVRTFLSVNNFDGKTIVPFCTHGGGGESSTYTDIQKFVPKAEVKAGYTSYERSAKDADIKKWIDEALRQGKDKI